MKKNIIISMFFFFLIIISVYPQNSCNVKIIFDKKSLTPVEEAVALYWKWDTDNEPEEAIKLLEDIYIKDKTNWLAPYWAAFISTQLGISVKGKANYMDKAQNYFDKAEESLQENMDSTAIPYFHALQSLIYYLKIGDMKNKKYFELHNKSLESLNKALEINPDIPALWVLSAINLADNSYGFLGNIMAATSLFEKAKKEFAGITNYSPADIRLWNKPWIDPWLNNLSKSLNKM